MQLSPHQRSNLQAKAVLAHTVNAYSHNLSPSLLMRSPVAHQPRPPEVRQVAIQLSRDVMSASLEGGGSRRVDFGTVMSHLLVGATAGSPRVPACEGDGGRKRSRPGEDEEQQSRTYNPSRPHEATIILPTTDPTGLSGYPRCDPQREQRKETSGPNIRGGGTEGKSRGGGAGRPARASSPRNQ